jgi:hypothetical protein
MGLKANFNPGQLEFSLRQIGERAVKGMSERMRRTVVKIRDLARDYAPHLTGDLESAIEYAQIKDGRRNAFVVFVDLDRTHGKNKDVGDYAFLMEENLRPYGRKSIPRSYQLGALSRQKAAGGKKVGGRFLARAIKEGTDELMADLAEEVRRVTNSRGGRVLPMNHEGRPAPDEE